MESNHPRSVTPRNSVLKTGKATGPYPSPRQRTYTAVRVSESGLGLPPFRERYGVVHSRVLVLIRVDFSHPRLFSRE